MSNTSPCCLIILLLFFEDRDAQIATIDASFEAAKKPVCVLLMNESLSYLLVFFADSGHSKSPDQIRNREFDIHCVLRTFSH